MNTKKTVNNVVCRVMESEEVLEGVSKCDRQLAVVSQLISESDVSVFWVPHNKISHINSKTTIHSGCILFFNYFATVAFILKFTS